MLKQRASAKEDMQPELPQLTHNEFYSPPPAFFFSKHANHQANLHVTCPNKQELAETIRTHEE